mmetsp:Transcript_36876/g.98218  ORF Transcript_36876/g.98218 Transcript_36876/m.98218 type:complete len:1163 (-) Transcript_36876:370-3858(-)
MAPLSPFAPLSLSRVASPVGQSFAFNRTTLGAPAVQSELRSGVVPVRSHSPVGMPTTHALTSTTSALRSSSRGVSPARGHNVAGCSSTSLVPMRSQLQQPISPVATYTLPSSPVHRESESSPSPSARYGLRTPSAPQRARSPARIVACTSLSTTVQQASCAPRPQSYTRGASFRTPTASTAVLQPQTSGANLQLCGASSYFPAATSSLLTSPSHSPSLSTRTTSLVGSRLANSAAPSQQSHLQQRHQSLQSQPSPSTAQRIAYSRQLASNAASQGLNMNIATTAGQALAAGRKLTPSDPVVSDVFEAVAKTAKTDADIAPLAAGALTQAFIDAATDGEVGTAVRGAALSSLLELVDAVLGSAPGDVGDELAAKAVAVAAGIMSDLPTGGSDLAVSLKGFVGNFADEEQSIQDITTEESAKKDFVKEVVTVPAFPIVPSLVPVTEPDNKEHEALLAEIRTTGDGVQWEPELLQKVLDRPPPEDLQHFPVDTYRRFSATAGDRRELLMLSSNTAELEEISKEESWQQEQQEPPPAKNRPQFQASSATKSKFKKNLLLGFHDGSLERVVVEAEATQAGEATLAGEATQAADANAVQQPKRANLEDHHASSETKSKFKKNLLGGLHDGSLQRVVDEAEALEEAEDAKTKVVEEAPKVDEPFHASSETKSKFKKNLLGGLRDGSLERVVDEAEALDEAEAKTGAVEHEACAQTLESMEVACVMEGEMPTCSSTFEAIVIAPSGHGALAEKECNLQTPESQVVLVAEAESVLETEPADAVKVAPTVVDSAPKASSKAAAAPKAKASAKSAAAKPSGAKAKASPKGGRQSVNVQAKAAVSPRKTSESSMALVGAQQMPAEAPVLSEAIEEPAAPTPEISEDKEVATIVDEVPAVVEPTALVLPTGDSTPAGRPSVSDQPNKTMKPAPAVKAAAKGKAEPAPKGAATPKKAAAKVTPNKAGSDAKGKAAAKPKVAPKSASKPASSTDAVAEAAVISAEVVEAVDVPVAAPAPSPAAAATSKQPAGKAVAAPKKVAEKAPAGKPAPKGSAKAPADKASEKGGSASKTPPAKGSAEPRSGSKAPKAVPGKKQPLAPVAKPKDKQECELPASGGLEPVDANDLPEVEDTTPDEVAEDNVLKEERSETVGEEDKSSIHEVFSRSPSQDLSQLNV